MNEIVVQVKKDENFKIILDENVKGGFNWKFKIIPESGITLVEEIGRDPITAITGHSSGYRNNQKTNEVEYFEEDIYEEIGKYEKEWTFVVNIVGEYIIIFESTNLVNQIIEDTKKYKVIVIDQMNVFQIMEQPLHMSLSMYGETVEGYIGKDIEFIIDDYLPEFRIELYNLYKPELYKKAVIIIKEVTWKYDINNKITVWYEKQNNGTYIPKHYIIYSNDMQF